MVHLTQPRSGSPIADLEATTQAAVDRAFASARREADRQAVTPMQITRQNATVVSRLRLTNAPVIEAIVNSVRRAVNLGVDDAVIEAPPPDTPEGRATAAAAHFNPHADDSTVDRLTADMNVSQSVRDLTSQAGAVAASDTRGILSVVNTVNRAANQLVVTRLMDAYNRGRRWYAGLFQYNLEWVTVGDGRVCEVCDPLNGVVLGSATAFRREGADFQGTPGQPPAHPRCRCYTRVVRP